MWLWKDKLESISRPIPLAVLLSPDWSATEGAWPTIDRRRERGLVVAASSCGQHCTAPLSHWPLGQLGPDAAGVRPRSLYAL
ncbi:hypothetical protein J6590_056764 [Homalodisca vitripennis]|nr:hypothetical protein J6590_056764 [Homalodisca vitripennis]